MRFEVGKEVSRERKKKESPDENVSLPLGRDSGQRANSFQGAS